VSILPHEAKALLDLFCVQQSCLAKGKINPAVIFPCEAEQTLPKIHVFTLVDQDWTDDFRKFCGSGLDRIQCLRIRIGSDSIFADRTAKIGLKNFSPLNSVPYIGRTNHCHKLGEKLSF